MINGHRRPTFFGSAIFHHQQDNRGFALSMEITNNEVMRKYIVFLDDVLTELHVPLIEPLPANASVPEVYKRNEIRLTLNCISEAGALTDAIIRGSAKVSLQWAIDQCPTAHPGADPSESVVSMENLKVVVWPVVNELCLIVRSFDAAHHFILLPHADLLTLMSTE